MKLLFERVEVKSAMWLGIIAFVILHGLDLIISHIGISIGSIEVGFLYSSGLTVQGIMIKMLGAFVIACILLQYKGMLVIGNREVINSGRLFKLFISGQLVIICLLVISLYIQMNGGV